MRKVFIYCLLASILIAACVTPETTVRRTTTAPTPVAVWDFEDLSPYSGHQYSYLKTLLADVAIKRLNELPGVQPIERSRLVKVLEEQALGSSELASESTRLRLGKLLGAREMVFGTFQILGDRGRIDVRVVDVETSRVLSADERTIVGFNSEKATKAVDEIIATIFSK